MGRRSVAESRHDLLHEYIIGNIIYVGIQEISVILKYRHENESWILQQTWDDKCVLHGNLVSITTRPMW
jgi:hypothetical protein